MEHILKQPTYRKKHKKVLSVTEKINVAEKTARRLTNEIKHDLKLQAIHMQSYRVNKSRVLAVKSTETELIMILSDKNRSYKITSEKHPKDVFDALLFLLTAIW